MCVCVCVRVCDTVCVGCVCVWGGVLECSRGIHLQSVCAPVVPLLACLSARFCCSLISPLYLNFIRTSLYSNFTQRPAHYPLPYVLQKLQVLHKLAMAEELLETSVAALMGLGFKDLPILYRLANAAHQPHHIGKLRMWQVSENCAWMGWCVCVRESVCAASLVGLGFKELPILYRLADAVHQPHTSAGCACGRCVRGGD